jgi:hypothetical protein
MVDQLFKNLYTVDMGRAIELHYMYFRTFSNRINI